MNGRFQPSANAKIGANTPLPESLDDALYACVYASGKPPKALADDIGVRCGYLTEAANRDREDTQFQARLIVPLTKATGNDAIVRYLAHAVGGVFVRVPADMQADEHTARSLKEFGEYLCTVANASADGIVTRAEADAARLQATEAIEAILAHVSAIEARAVDITPILGLRRV